ncbi:MAG: family 43 glycosylhydrolase [Clostridiales bacterium]|nr:family 43 glycosylhydrolase [Clostridiales bacterium]
MIWKAELGNGRYRNPIIYTDYSDPDVIKGEDGFYMVASSFGNIPGLPILYSKDLINWDLINYAIHKLPGKPTDDRRPQYGKGVWAPSIRLNNGVYYIFFPIPDEGIFVTSSLEPRGKWSEPRLLMEGKGMIDPCPFWDDDGRAYLVNAVAKSRTGYNNVLYITEMSVDGRRLLGERTQVYDGASDGNTTTEGPRLYKRDGHYYIFAPAGGVKEGWQVVLKSDSIYGPYEARTVMRQGNTEVNGPHQGAWVVTPGGEDHFVHFQDVGAGGRIVHLQPMRWREDGFPVIGIPTIDDPTVGEPVGEWEKPKGVNAFRYIGKGSNFSSILPWQYNGEPSSKDAVLRENPFSITIPAVSVREETALALVPDILLRKWESPEFIYEGKIDISELREGDMCGIISMGLNYASLAIKHDTDNLIKILKITGEIIFDGSEYSVNETREEIGSFTDVPEVSFNFLVQKSNTVILSFFTKGAKTISLRTEGNPGRWVGAKYGFYNIRPEAGDAGADRKESRGFITVKDTVLY